MDLASLDNQPTNQPKGKVRLCVCLEYLTEIEDGLSPSCLELFRNTCFGPFLTTKTLNFYGTLYLNLISCQDQTRSLKSVTFNVGTRAAVFGPIEFALLTGLKFGQKPSTPTTSMIHSTYFPDLGDEISVLDIENAFQKCEPASNPDKVKIALLLVLYGVILAQFDSTRVDMEYFHLVDDIDEFNKYPWGRVGYEHLIGDIRENGEKYIRDTKKKLYLNAKGFTFALQCWALEVIPSVARLGGKLIDPLPEKQNLPRMAWWKCEKTTIYMKELNKHAFIDTSRGEYPAQNIIVHERLEAHAFEEDKEAYTSAREWETSIEINRVQLRDKGKGIVDEMHDEDEAANEDDIGQKQHPVGTTKLNVPIEVHNFVNKKFNVVMEKVNKIEHLVMVMMTHMKCPMTSDPYYAQKKKATVSSSSSPTIEEAAILTLLQFTVPGTDEPSELWNDAAGAGVVKDVGNQNTRDVFECLRDEDIAVADIAKETTCSQIPQATGFEKTTAEGKYTEEIRTSTWSSSTMYDPFSKPSRARSSELFEWLAFHRSTQVQIKKARGRPKKIKTHVTPHVLRQLPIKITEKVDANWMEELCNHDCDVRGTHVDALMHFVMLKAWIWPDQFLHGWSCVDEFFLNALNIAYPRWVAAKGERKWDWFAEAPDVWRFVVGENPCDGKPLPWNQANHIYGIDKVNFNHWVLYDIDLTDHKIVVYDPMIIRHTGTGNQFDMFTRLAEMMPSLLAIHYDQLLTENVQWSIQAFDLPQCQNKTHDCGILCLKMLECLVVGRSVVEVNFEGGSTYREDYAVELYDFP